MPVFCSLHRTVPAHFQCDSCGSTLCEDCASFKKTPGYGGVRTDYFCPGCEVPVRTLGLGNIMEPFWHRLSSIFTYPLQLTPLILIFILALLETLFPENIFVRLLVWVVMMKYAYAVLIATAQGALQAPQLSWKLINENVEQVFKQFVVLAIFAFLGFQITLTSIAAGIAFALVVVACIPAILMILVATNSILQAVNPAMFIPIIKRIGWPYLLLYLFLFFLFVAPATLLHLLASQAIPYQLYHFLSLFLSQLYTLISFHLMGYVLLQYHEEIGYSVDYEFFISHRRAKKRKKKTAKQELQTGLSLLLKAGKNKEALQRMRPFVLTENPDPELSEKFYKLLTMAGEDKIAEKYLARHLDVLVSNNRKQKATEIFLKAKKSPAGPPAAESVYKVASWFEQLNDWANAVATYSYFARHYKKHPLIPEVYFQLARLLHEKGQDTEKAKEILAAIIKAFPKHDLAPKAKEYLTLVA